ncbi:enoyl-CoA hydratase/isomerase family protein [Bacillus sp. MRMR6]|uniref:enoyl-CoA hydratase/isomerase family protein n=1 Tax=Bacillus sp. MRMR6 TaxID=1928617 RepID=UPI0009F86A8A|nr:enoyl-CoA hydratase/isomerase family protein [Bacillus sp. MRMR6]
MRYQEYQTLKIKINSGIAFVTNDHPPINLFDSVLFNDLSRFYKEVKDDYSIKVIAFNSADPDFFIPHYDVEDILKLSEQHTTVPRNGAKLTSFNILFENYRKLSKVTMVRIDGRVGGGGNEFILALDMRFATIGKAYFIQPEVGLGVIPGAGGTQYLPRLMGRSRALEVILGYQDIDALTAEKYGMVNRALPEAEMDFFFEELAIRIASFPQEALQLAKEAVDKANTHIFDGLLEERQLFLQSVIIIRLHRIE